MQRRKFVIGMGALASGAAAAMGTGAFTSVEADRDLAVNVAEDSNSFLALSVSDGPNGAYAEESGDTLSVAFDGSITDDDGEPSGNGFNPDAQTIIRNVFDITNQGTQTVNIWIDGLKEPHDQEGISMYSDNKPDDSSGSINGEENSVEVAPGETLGEIGFIVYGNPQFDDDQITIHAKADSEL